MDNGKYECQYCNRHFQRSFNLKRHLEMIHNRYTDGNDFDSNELEESVADDESNTQDEEESNTRDEEESNTQDEEESNTHEDESSAEDESDVNSSNLEEELNEDEWMTYANRLDSFMMQVYEDAYDKVMPADEVTDGDNMETDNDETDERDYTRNENVLKIAKKLFRKRLTNYLIILYGLQRDTKYDRLFAKIEKYINRDLNLHTAISMAVKTSGQIIDDDFDDSIRREFEGSSSKHEESSSSGEVTESDEETDL